MANNGILPSALTRRTLLAGTGSLAVLATAGCNLVGTPEATTEETTQGTDPTSRSETENSTEGSTSLSGEVTIVLVPDPPGASEFYRAQMDVFTEKTGVTVNVIENPADQQLNALELMFQQGSSPDVMRVQDVPAVTRFNERGWLAPLDDLLTDEFKSRFPDGALEPSSSGLHFNGKMVSIPLTWGDWAYSHLWLWNKGILAEYGYTEAPKTFSELVEIATAITEGGGGQVFGVAPIATRFMADGAQEAWQRPGVSLLTGEPSLADPRLVEMVEMWRQLQANGINMPGWETWDGSRAFTEFAAGRLAMYPSAAWHVAEIIKLNPEIELGIAPIPVPDSGRVAYAQRTASYQPIWSMSSESQNPEAALALMDFLASVDFYKAYYEQFGTLTAAKSAWDANAQDDPALAGIMAVQEETIKTVPNPVLLAEGAEAFWTEASGHADLNWEDAIDQSIIGNEDFGPLAEAMDAKMAELIATHEADVPNLKELLTFPDWDPLEDFTG